MSGGGEIRNVLFQQGQSGASGGGSQQFFGYQPSQSPQAPQFYSSPGGYQGGGGEFAGGGLGSTGGPGSGGVKLDFFVPDSPGGGDPTGDMMSGASMPPPMASVSRSDTMTGLAGLYDDGDEDYANEPPLLEELGVNFEHILSRTKAVLQPFKPADLEALADGDLTGPLVFCLCLGFSLLLQGKVHFGYIYGYGVFGCTSLYLLLNLLRPPRHDAISFWSIVSTVGYCLLPVVLVAVVGIIFDMRGWFGNALATGCVGWSTLAATRQFEKLFDMRQQRYLMAYPIGLLYTCFVLIAMF